MQRLLNSSTQKLDHRPPTPPQEPDCEIEEALAFLRDESDLPETTGPQQISSDTPPSSSPLRSLQRENVIIKRVEFLATPTYHAEENSNSSPKSSPARSKLLRPAKSILKLGNVSPLPTPDDNDQQQSYFSGGSPQSFTKMLDVALRQLETPSTYARLDAYLAIHNALTTYEDVPRYQEILQRLDNLQRLILRDTTSRELEEGADSNINVQALKLAAKFVSDEGHRSALSQDFQTSILDRCIAILERDARSKAVFKMALGLMAQQIFPATVMTPAKAERLIALLQDAETRYAGNSVIAARLMIYRRLLTQVPPTMSANLRHWLQHLLHGMISEVHDTRLRATDICNHVAMLYGANSSAARTLHELLETRIEESNEAAYFEFFSMRITELMKDENARSLVPRIWSSVVLFHRSSKSPIHKWRRFKNWLQLMQPCLLAADSQLRREAHLAWRKLIYVVQPDANMPTMLTGLLLKPIAVGFSRNGTDSKARELRQLALDGYFNLLHYALRPGNNAQSIEFAWKHYVHDTLRTMTEASSKGRSVACRILNGLFTPHTGTWNVQAAFEEAAIVPEELPRLPVRWIRDHLHEVLPLVRAVVLSSLLSIKVDHIEQATTLWTSLIQCLVEASAQEIRQSPQTKLATTQVIHTLQELFEACSQDERSSTQLLALQELTFSQLNVYSSYHDLPIGGKDDQSTVAHMIYHSNAMPALRPVEKLLRCFNTLDTSVKLIPKQISALWSTISSIEKAPLERLQAIWLQLSSILSRTFRQMNQQEELGSLVEDSMIMLYLAPPSLKWDSLLAREMVELVSVLFTSTAQSTGHLTICSTIVDPVSQSHLQETSLSHTGSLAFVQSVLENAARKASQTTGFQAQLNSIYTTKAFHALIVRSSNIWHAAASVPHLATELLSLLLEYINASPVELRISVLWDLAPAITPWLQDDNHRKEFADQLSALYGKLFMALVDTGTQVLDVCSIEPLLLAGLQVVTAAAVTFWNHCADKTVIYSEPLQRLLQALSTDFDIQLPMLTVTDAGPLLPVAPAPAQHEADLIGLVTRSPVTRDILAESARPTRRKLFGAPRLRHDDSQVEFVPIATVPSLQSQESQHLTDNQREVLERQHAVAQAYPELSSSPTIMLGEHDAAGPLQLDFDLTSTHAAPFSSSPHGNEDQMEADITSSPPQQAQLDAVPLNTTSKDDEILMDADPVSSPIRQAEQAAKLASPEGSPVNNAEHSLDHATQPLTQCLPQGNASVVSAEVDAANAQLQLETELAASNCNEGQAQSAVDCSIMEEDDVPQESTSRKRKREKSTSGVRRSKRKSTTPRSQQKSGNETEDEIVVTSSQCSTRRVPANIETPVKTSVSQSQSDSGTKSTVRRHKIELDDHVTRRATMPASSGDDDIGESQRQSQEGNAVEPTTSQPVLETLAADDNSAARTSPSRAVINTATGLMHRLKEALSDCRNMVFGPREEREIDDLLFELRQATHEAGRRGRHES